MSDGRPIYWHEGVFLRPQHFQQQDDFHDGKRQRLLAATRPYTWGVLSLSVSESALRRQVFEVEECEILFQDGALVRYPGNARIAPRSFEGAWDASGKPLPIYLGLKSLAPEGVNVALRDGSRGEDGPGEASRARFRPSQEDEVTRDLYARSAGDPLLYLEYAPRFFFGDEVAEAADHHTVRIAEVQRVGTEVRLVPDAVPPVLSVQASPYLLRLLRDLGEQLTARGHELALFKRGRGIEAPDLGSRDLLYLLGLITLNRWIPRVHQCLEVPETPPLEFYTVLRQIVGELSTFSTRYDVFGAPAEGAGGTPLPGYRHEEPGPCFTAAVRTISRLLEELTAGPDFVAELYFDGTYYYADVPERVFQGSNRYYLCVRSRVDPDAMAGTLQTLAKLSAKEYLPILIARALPGVALEYLSALPSELPRRSDAIYFALEDRGAAWDAVRENRNAAIYFETVPEDVEIELMVVYGK